jgi:hypothetical protein
VLRRRAALPSAPYPAPSRAYGVSPRLSRSDAPTHVCSRCGDRASSIERDHGRAEQANQDTLMCSRWRAFLLPAGIRLRAAVEGCNKPSI